MAYTLGEAAKATGKSKATISKAIKSGRISASKHETGAFKIDPSELHRVYPPTPPGDQKETPESPKVNTSESGDLKALQARLEAIQERLDDKEAVISDLREDRDKWRQQATALLEDKRPKGFFRRLLGG
jgi:3-hydroxyacyl-CoA dehydrogenase